MLFSMLAMPAISLHTSWRLPNNDLLQKLTSDVLEREVRKANRDLSHLLANIETPLARLDLLQKKYTELLADMKRVEREHIKAKKRADLLQKEKDASRSELSKTITRKDALEKLCRELQLQNKKLKVCLASLRKGRPIADVKALRTITSAWGTLRRVCGKICTTDSKEWSTMFKK